MPKTSPSALSIEALLWTNPEVIEVREMEGEGGFVDVERSDVDEVAIHFRQTDSEHASMSAYLSRAQAAALLAELMCKIVA